MMGLARRSPDGLLRAACRRVTAWHTAWLKGWIFISSRSQRKPYECTDSRLSLQPADAAEAPRFYNCRINYISAGDRCEHGGLLGRQCGAVAPVAVSACGATGLCVGGVAL